MAHAARITLSDHQAQFIHSQIASGRFRDPSDVLLAGLTLLEEREEKLHALREALVEGEQSGDAGALDFDEIKRAARALREGTGDNGTTTHEGSGGGSRPD